MASKVQKSTNCPTRLVVTLIKDIEKYSVHGFLHDHNNVSHLEETIGIFIVSKTLAKSN